jgi:hypothetical protein
VLCSALNMQEEVLKIIKYLIFVLLYGI